MIVYDSAYKYIESKKSLADQITAITAIITALTTTALKAASTGNVTEYDLDTGQSKIKALYRSPLEVANAIKAFRSIRQNLINDINGRAFRLVDGKNFVPPYGNC